MDEQNTSVDTSVDTGEATSDWDSVGDISRNDDPDTDDYKEDTAAGQTEADEQKNDGKQEESESTADATGPVKDAKQTDTTTQETAETSDPTFELKYLGEVKVVKKDEVVKLAQQGLDYDRIRAKYDEIKADMEQYTGLDDGIAYLKEMAALAGKPVDKFIEDVRVNALVEAGWDAASAREKIAFEREKRTINAKQAKTDRAEKAEADKKQERELMFKEFANLYPNVKPEEIPPEVFAAIESGKRLSDAYELHTTKTERKALTDKVDSLTKEIEALKKNSANAAKSIGSKASSGNKSSASDPYIDDWYKH